MNIYNHAVFPSIITEFQCDLYHYIRNDLIDWIYGYQSITHSVFRSNRGGWQSPSDFHEQESFLEFKNYILNNALQALAYYNQKFEMGNMWININKKDNYNILHNHPGSSISGVFWVKTPKKCGPLVFFNQHNFVEHNLLTSINDDFKSTFKYDHMFIFTPREGTLVLFPSHLLHNVEPNESDEDRISIAFNLR